MTLIVFLMVLPPAFSDVTLKDALTLPGFFGLTLTLTVLVVPPSITPTEVLKVRPRPLTLRRTPVAAALPELEMATL